MFFRSVVKKINNNKIILIDIKDNMDIDILYKVIKKYSYLNILLASFNYELIKKIKEKYNLRCGLIIGYYINEDKINSFDFNVVTYYYRNKVDKKEPFIWTINEYKKDLNNYNVITDKPYLMIF